MKWIIFGLLVPAMAWAEVQPPVSLRLDPSGIQTIAIHPGMDTLLMFPEPVTLIAGNGLTGGEGQGIVHFEQAEDPRLILLRQIQPNQPVLMHVVMATEGYSFRLIGSENPATIIRFIKADEPAPAAVIPEAEVRKELPPVSAERQEQLLKLALGEAVLKARLPSEYQDFRSVPVDAVSELDGLQIRLLRAARFDREDAVVLITEIRDAQGGTLDLAGKEWLIQVGEKRVYRPTHFGIQGDPVQGKLTAAFILIGDGRGSPLHLSPENRFAVTYRQANQPPTP